MFTTKSKLLLQQHQQRISVTTYIAFERIADKTTHFKSFSDQSDPSPIMSEVNPNEAEKNIEIWKVKKLIKRLEAARGNGTSMISLIIREHNAPLHESEY